MQIAKYIKNNYPKLLWLAFVLVVLGYVGWMNTTPGHFQRLSDCEPPRYINNSPEACSAIDSADPLWCYCSPKDCATTSQYCPPKFPGAIGEYFLLFSSGFDLNK